MSTDQHELLAALGRQSPEPEDAAGAVERRRRVVSRLAALDSELDGRARRSRRRGRLLGVAIGLAATAALGVSAVREWQEHAEPGQAPTRAHSMLEAGPTGAQAPAVGSTAVAPVLAEPVTPPPESIEAPRGVRPSPATPARSAARTSTLPEENELFTKAKAAVRRGELAQGVADLEAFVSRYPRSPLTQNAYVERFRALAKLGQQARAAQAAQRYLADYPKGFAREEAQELAVP